MTETEKASFSNSFNAVVNEVHSDAIEKGWWRDGVANKDLEKIALMHSELGEATEWYRQGNPPSDHIAPFSGIEEEMADVVIRIMDYCTAHGSDLASAILAKIEFNKTREYRHGGKAA